MGSKTSYREKKRMLREKGIYVSKLMVRISPEKLLRYLRLIKGKRAVDAKAFLSLMPGKAPRLLVRFLDSSIANAVNNFEEDEENLYVKSFDLGKGPHLRRFWPRSHGRVYPINRYYSRITLYLEAKEEE